MHLGIRKALFKQRRVRRATRAGLVVLLILVAVGTALLAWAGSGLTPPRFRLAAGAGRLEPIDYPVWRSASDRIARRKYIALTFDDGPYGAGVDERILRILAKHHAHAIFFEVCSHITDKTVDVPREIVAAGSVLGNHSYDHLHLPKLGRKALIHQVDGCSDRLELVGAVRPRLFRPPFGQTSPVVLQAIHSAGMQQVLWDANSGDSWLHSPAAIVKLALNEASHGSILLMHSRPTTADALDELLTKLQRRGFRFVLPEGSNGQMQANRQPAQKSQSSLRG